MLVGREQELGRIESLLAAAREGRSAALVLRGEAGIGKSALLAAAAEAPGFRVLRCAGVQSEADLPFAALQQLLSPVANAVDRLPEPQAAALGSVFGLGSGRLDDRLLLGLATLNLLAEAAEEAPLACLVDDLQWVDVPSAQALLFAARRLDSEGILMLLAVRDGGAARLDVPELQELRLAGLPDEAARTLLASRGGTAVESVLREAAGNPLALLELSLDGRDGGGVEAAFRARVLALPPETKRLLLVAACADDEHRTWREAAAVAGVDPAACAPAVAAGLVGDGDAIVFRHPLVRAAVRKSASRADLGDAHQMLAAASEDTLARALYLAAATQGEDESIGALLEDAAADAARRGAFASASEAFSRAAALSGDSATRSRRLALAAQTALDAGAADRAAELVDEALPGAAAEAERARLAAVRGALELQRGTPARAYEILSKAARAVVDDDAAQALGLEGAALGAAFVAGWPERAFGEARALLERIPPTGRQEDAFIRVFLDGAAALLGGRRDEARPLLQDAIAAGSRVDDLRFVIWVGMASVYLGDLASAREHYRRAAASARAAGSFTVLPQALMALARLSVYVRDTPTAEEYAREGTEIVRQLGQENPETGFSAILVRCLAARGEVDACRELAEGTLRRASAHDLGVAAADVRLGLAELELSLGNGAAARAQIEAITHALMRLGAAADLLEAMLMDGDADAAGPVVDQLAAYVDGVRDPYFVGLLLRCRALLEPDPVLAEPHFAEAAELHSRHAPPFDRARTQLAYGEFLRRLKRRTEARTQLESSLITFEGLGTPLWAARARAELEATGITARKRDPSTLATLTPQELRIARLVAGGAANRDVAAQLFLSPKTVEYHLRKVFQKLGVSSRVELARQPFEPVPV